MKNHKIPKILLIILVAIVVLYIALGYLVLPKIVKSQLVSRVSELTDSKVTLESVDTNPLLLTASLNDFKLSKENSEIVSFKKLFIDFKLNSLIKRSLNFSEIILTKPLLNLSISKEGKLNLLDLIPQNENEEVQKEEKKDGDLLALLINKISFEKGNILFEDFSNDTPYKTEIKDLSFTLRNLSTHPEKEGIYKLDANLAENGVLNWNGTLDLNPVRSAGTLMFEKVSAKNIWEYIQDRVNFVIDDGELNILGKYSFDFSGNDNKFNINNSQISLNSFSMLEKESKKEIFTISSATASGIAFDLGKKVLSISELKSNSAKATARISDNGTLNFKNLTSSDDIPKDESTEPDQNKSNLNIKINTADFSDYSFSFDSSDEEKELVIVPSFTVSDFDFNLSQKSIDILKITTSKGKVLAKINENGELNFKKLAGNNSDEKSVEKVQKKSSFDLKINEVDLSGYNIGFEDKTNENPVNLLFNPTVLNIKNFALGQSKSPVSFTTVLNDSGKINIDGEINNPGFTSDLKLNLSNIPLNSFEPYIADFANIDIENANLSLTGELQNLLEENKRNIKYSGDLNLDSTKIKQAGSKDDLFRWAYLKVSNAGFDLLGRSLNIKKINVDKLYSNVVVSPEGKVNFKNIVKNDNKNTTSSKTENEKFITEISEVNISGGTIEFADQSVDPAFDTTISEINAKLTGLSTKRLDTAKIDLKGKFDKYAPVVIIGEINPLGEKTKTDIDIDIEGVELTSLNPYSTKHVGYKLDRGKLNLDLEYTLNEKILDGKNRIVFNQIKLGEKVESPVAKDLPLELAISLLKDRSGDVKLDFPVSGDPSDPKFSVSNIIFDTFFKLLFKTVTSPFSILGSIVGIFGGGEELSYVSFEPGSSKITDKEKKELEELLKALSERPNLKLDIRGTAYNKIDRLALAERQIINSVRDDDKHNSDEPPTEDEMEDILEIYENDYGVNPLDKVPDEDENGRDIPKSQRIRTAYNNSIGQLKDFETVKDDAMIELAKSRAESIRNFLTQKQMIEQDRIFTLEPSIEIADASEGVRVSLGLDTF